MLIDSANDELRQIESIFKRWLVGGGSVNLDKNCLPKSWLPIVDSDLSSQQSLRLKALILASQQQAWLLRKQPPENLQAKKELPELELPCLSNDLRPAFRNCLQLVKKQQAISTVHLLNLMLDRKLIAHPVDWLPGASEDVPEVYWPWSKWVSNQAGSEIGFTSSTLNEENWDEFYPAERLALLKTMRHKSADEARVLIEKCSPKEPAEKRFKIIEILGISLSEKDQEFLIGLTNDRSKKIVQLSKQFLSRLGYRTNSDVDEDLPKLAKELAEWFETKTVGLRKNKIKVLPLKLKSKKQRSLRSEWLNKVPLNELAEALSVNLKELVVGWQFSENRDHDNHNFVTNALQNLPDQLIDSLLNTLLVQNSSEQNNISLIQLLLPRLQQEVRTKLMMELLQRKETRFSFYDCLQFVDGPLETIDWELLKKTQAWKMLVKDIRKALIDDSYIEDYYCSREIIAIGLFVSRNCAEQIISNLVDIGVMQIDPVLDLIKFNIQLSDQNIGQI